MLLEKFRKLKKYDPKKADELHENIEREGGLEKGDMKAMILAALIVIMPVALGILLLFVLFSWLFVKNGL